MDDDALFWALVTGGSVFVLLGACVGIYIFCYFPSRGVRRELESGSFEDPVPIEDNNNEDDGGNNVEGGLPSPNLEGPLEITTATTKTDNPQLAPTESYETDIDDNDGDGGAGMAKTTNGAKLTKTASAVVAPDTREQ